MQLSTPSLRASRVLRHPKLHLEADPRGEITHYGGLVLAQQFVRRFRVAQQVDDALHLLKRHLPYHESDHVLALAYTLFAFVAGHAEELR